MRRGSTQNPKVHFILRMPAQGSKLDSPWCRPRLLGRTLTDLYHKPQAGGRIPGKSDLITEILP